MSDKIDSITPESFEIVEIGTQIYRRFSYNEWHKWNLKRYDLISDPTELENKYKVYKAINAKQKHNLLETLGSDKAVTVKAY